MRPRGCAWGAQLRAWAQMLVVVWAAGLLVSSAMPLAAAPPESGPGLTPACPAPAYADTASMLVALPAASYACAEELAAALAPRADVAAADALLAMLRGGAHSRERRNALRALGRLAERPRGSRAHELVLRARAAAVQAAAADLLAVEEDASLLQDAVWILDTFFYPSYSAAPALDQLAGGPAYDPALRYRAAAARARLVFARPGPLLPADRAFILGGLGSDDPGVRAAAALASARLREAQLGPAAREELAAALAAAWSAEPPLALAPDGPDPRAAGLLTFVESSPTSLTARAAIARAQDRLAGGAAHLARLRAAYESLALPHTFAVGALTIRSGLPADQLPALAAEVRRAEAAIAQIVGPGLAAPLPGESAPALTILIFARQGVYRDYMRAFTPFAVDVDGTYDEASATLYTHQRTPAQSENTLIETLRHELAHHYAGARIFPGRWTTAGYHGEPKGWADEGLAELLAGLAAGGPAPRPRQLARLCARPAPPDLGGLLARREGYDRFGSFDYDGAWALSFYLLGERPEALRRLYAAYRDGSYRLSAWGLAAGVSVAQVEQELRDALRGWCALSP